MDIVKTDEYVNEVRSKRLFRDAQWSFYNRNGHVRRENGMYLICDNGYLRWPTTICPFTRRSNSSPEGVLSVLAASDPLLDFGGKGGRKVI
jgi:hypothetical protein